MKYSSDWPTKKLGEVAEIIAGFAWPSNQFGNEGLRIIRIQNLGDNRLADWVYWDEEGGVDKKFLVGDDDILVGLSGSFKVELWQRGKALLNQRIAKIKADESKILPEFLSPAIKLEVEKTFRKSAGSTVIANVKMGTLRNLKIPVPPIEKQRQIIKKLEEILGKIEEAKTLRQEAVEETEQLLDFAFSKILVEGNWNTKTLSEVCKVNPSKTEIREATDDVEVTFVPMAAVSGVVGQITTPEIKKLGKVRKGYTYFREGDILFAKITPCMENGKAAVAKNLINGLGFGSTEFHVLRPQKDALPEWVFLYIRRKSFREEAAKYMTGTAGQQRVPKNYLENVVIPIPPLPEQQRIVEYLDGLQEKVSQLQTLQSETQEELEELEQSVLAKAFEGEL